VQIISRIFAWTSIPELVTRIAKRKQEVYNELLSGVNPPEVPGTRQFILTLKRNNVSENARQAGCSPVL
jgi:hypothetical protein